MFSKGKGLVAGLFGGSIAYKKSLYVTGNGNVNLRDEKSELIASFNIG
jgi:hypothetical protein